jgi:putative transposase
MRIDLPNATYFASVTTAGSRQWFAETRHAEVLSRLICAERGRSDLLHGFVVMPDHYHVLLTLVDNHRIHQVIQRVNSLSARRVNAVEGRHGRLWARRFYDHVIRNQDDFDECLRYIHDNPRVAGLVTVSSAYRYSSAGYWENAKSAWGEFDPP